MGTALRLTRMQLPTIIKVSDIIEEDCRMPKRVEPLVIQETDRNTLLDIVSGRAAVGTGIVKRAQAILRMSEGVQLKTIAAELDLRPNTITEIRNRYLKQGIFSLGDRERSGRPVESPRGDLEKSLEKIIQDAQRNGTAVPSANELSLTLKAPVANVRKYLKQKGIVQARKRTWDFRTSDGLVAHYIDVVGVYLSPKQQVFIVQTSSDALESQNPQTGSLTVRNRILAHKIEELAGADGGIELAKALEAFESIPSDQELTHQGNGLTYVQSVIEAFPVSPRMEYHIFACGDPIIENSRTMIQGAYLHNEETLEGWNAQVESIISVLYRNGENAEAVIGICNGIETYLRRRCQVPDTFEWRKVAETRQNEPNEATGSNIEAPCVFKPGDVVSTTRVMGDDGQWITITTRGHCNITQAEFDTSSKESYLLSFHKVEQTILAVTHEASRSLSEKYLNEIGKKKHNQAMNHV